jgi:thioredoxin 1
MASDAIVQVTGESFESAVLRSPIPILVDFWAAWCGPCRIVTPVLEELADEYRGRVAIAKLDVDENQQLAFQFGVSSIPTFILFRDGKVLDRMMGAVPKSAFRSFVDRNL